MAPPVQRHRQSYGNIIPVVLIVALQAFAGLFFIADALSDDGSQDTAGFENILETSVALALLAGTILGAIYVYRLVKEIRLRSSAVAVARGAMSSLIR